VIDGGVVILADLGEKAGQHFLKRPETMREKFCDKQSDCDSRSWCGQLVDRIKRSDAASRMKMPTTAFSNRAK
jgi:hypothetical protein